MPSLLAEMDAMDSFLAEADDLLAELDSCPAISTRPDEKLVASSEESNVKQQPQVGKVLNIS